jgi:uncharacterized protein YkwD
MRIAGQTFRLVLLIAVLAATLVSGASSAGDRADRLLAPETVCPGSNQVDAKDAVQMTAMACLVAYLRARAGLPFLRPSNVLDRAATLKVHRDLQCDEFSHTPCSAGFLTVFSQSGYIRGTAAFAVAENLAWAQGVRGSPRQIMRMWLHSPEHLRNLLSRRWRDFGLSVCTRVAFLGLRNVTLWANEFGARS